MRITKQQILKSIEKANNYSPYNCDRCWVSHLGHILRIENNHPCSCIKELLNEQYHTNYKITPGSCKVDIFPTKEILIRLKSSRTVRI